MTKLTNGLTQLMSRPNIAWQNISIVFFTHNYYRNFSPSFFKLIAIKSLISLKSFGLSESQKIFGKPEYQSLRNGN